MTARPVIAFLRARSADLRAAGRWKRRAPGGEPEPTGTDADAIRLPLGDGLDADPVSALDGPAPLSAGGSPPPGLTDREADALTAAADGSACADPAIRGALLDAVGLDRDRPMADFLRRALDRDADGRRTAGPRRAGSS